VEGSPEGTQVIMNIHRLIDITGNLDVPGGNAICRSAYAVTTYPYSTGEVIQLYGEELHWNLSKKRIGTDKYPLVKNFRAWAQEDSIIEQMETGKPYPIHGLWVQANNFLANQAQDTKRHYEACRKLDFNVVVDVFMTPTAQLLADIVLPAGSFPEKDSLYCIGGPLNIIRKVIDVPECKSDWEINFTLAKRLNPGAVPWNNVKEMLTDRMKPSGYTFETLSEKVWDLAPKGHHCGSTPYRRYEKGLLRPDKKPGFRTPTGKVELYSTVFEELGYDPLPCYEEPPESPVRTPELFEEYPLILSAGSKFMPMFHSEHRQLGIGMREKHPDPLVHIHPETASQLGISQGDWVYVETKRGRIRQRANVTESISQGMADAESSWWFPEKPGELPTLFGALESNTNMLTNDDPDMCDPLVGSWSNRALLCRIYKAEKGETL